MVAGGKHNPSSARILIWSVAALVVVAGVVIGAAAAVPTKAAPGPAPERPFLDLHALALRSGVGVTDPLTGLSWRMRSDPGGPSSHPHGDGGSAGLASRSFDISKMRVVITGKSTMAAGAFNDLVLSPDLSANCKGKVHRADRPLVQGRWSGARSLLTCVRSDGKTDTGNELEIDTLAIGGRLFSIQTASPLQAGRVLVSLVQGKPRGS